eukprot:scaffold40912_cov63-Phaeocystis_antarctica.AAC.5
MDTHVSDSTRVGGGGGKTSFFRSSPPDPTIALRHAESASVRRPVSARASLLALVLLVLLLVHLDYGIAGHIDQEVVGVVAHDRSEEVAPLQRVPIRKLSEGPGARRQSAYEKFAPKCRR